MIGRACNACNKELENEAEQRLHYKSEWHRYNLKRKVAGVPGVTEALFLARQGTLAEDKTSGDQTPMLFSCAICAKGYRSFKAHAEHLKSRNHIMNAAADDEEDVAIVRPLKQSGEDEWEEVDSENYEGLDPSCCFMCDKEHETIESCIVHLHKHHGFFVPDIEYLKDSKGLLNYLGLKVKRDYICLYCNERCQPFTSLEAVRKHMVAKSHCRVHYGDGEEEEEAELEDFYDYSSSYVDEARKQLVISGESANSVELGSGGAELIITTRTDQGISSKALGSREFMLYYRQKPRPSANHMAITAAVAARYKSMGLTTVQSKERTMQMKVLKELRRSGVEAMRSKIGMKSNVIRNLPSNVPY